LAIGFVIVIADVAFNSENGTTGSTATTAFLNGPLPTDAAPTVVFMQSGSGAATTSSFHVQDEWQLAWTYDCASFGQAGNFIVQIAQPPGDIGVGVTGYDGPVNQLGTGGSGVQSYHYGGTIFLEVNSECSWSIKVTG
jgi:hypothetical protein